MLFACETQLLQIMFKEHYEEKMKRDEVMKYTGVHTHFPNVILVILHTSLGLWGLR